MAIIDGNIRCAACGEVKPVASFAPALVRRGFGECRVCKNARNRDYAARNPEKVRAYALEHNDRNRAVVRKRALASYYRNHDERRARSRAAYQRPEGKRAAHDKHLRRKFGISAVDYDAMLLAQGGTCALCRKPPGPRRKLAVDHDHDTGRIRGLLCAHCNTSLGALGDTPAAIEKVLAYVRSEVPAVKPSAPVLRINLLGAN